jgi:hypothetical protein
MLVNGLRHSVIHGVPGIHEVVSVTDVGKQPSALRVKLEDEDRNRFQPLTDVSVTDLVNGLRH